MASQDSIAPTQIGSQKLQGTPSPRKLPPAIVRYGLAILSVALALVPALLLQHYNFHGVELPLFLLAIALTAWYGGVGPAVLAIVLSTFCFIYFFTEPIYSFVFTVADVPAIVILVCFAALIARFSAVRRRFEAELLQARDELQRLEATLSQAQRIARIGVWVTRSPMIPEYWSPTAFEIFGVDPAKGAPQNVEEFMLLVHPEDRERVLRETDVLETGRVFECKYRIIRPDGVIRIIREVGSPLPENNVVQRFVGAWMDITEQEEMTRELQRREAALQDSEEQWRAAFESNPTMYFMLDGAAVIVSVNAFGAEQLGYGVGELVGQPVLNIFYEPDRAAIQNHAKECFDKPGQTMRWEARKIRKDGSMLWVRETASAVVLKKQPVLLVVCENITEQKRAEEVAQRSEKELRDIVETMPAMGWSALPDGSNAFVTSQWTEYTGVSVEQMSGSGWQSTVHPEDLNRHLAKWHRAVTTGQALENEVRFRAAADGQYRWFLVRSVPLRDEQGNISKWYGVATDIDDRKRAEALLSGEKRILEMVAKGDSLAQVLDSLCRLVEEQASGVLASILLVDSDRLRHGGAPSLPKAYTDAIDGVVIGPSVGSCGTAAFLGKQVIVRDIATDPLWADYRAAALPHSLRACWSTPVFSSQAKVMATFAMYYREPRSPGPRDQEIIEQITHLAGVAIERKQTQEALRRGEAYLAEAQRLSKIGSWAFSPATGKTHYWSDEMFRIWGFDGRLGPPDPQAVLQRIHPEDRDLIRESFERALEGHLTSDTAADHRILLPDGTVKYIHGISHPIFGEAGQVIEYVGTAIDVTDRIQAEEALRRSEAYLAGAQRLSKTGSWAWDPHSDRMLHGSEELNRMFDIAPAEGTPSIELLRQRVHPEDRERVTADGVRASDDRTAHTLEYKLLLPDGAIKHVLSKEHLVLDQAGEIVEVIGTVIDVTERKLAEAELDKLHQLEEDLARMNRVSMMGELAASLAHEIKQPIAAAVTNAKTGLRWLQRQPPDAGEAREALSRIVRDGMRAADIIDRNRALYRRGKPKAEIIHLNELVHEMTALLRDAAARYSISIRIELEKALPTIAADRVQLQQVLMNLMLNAVEAMKDTGGELTIRSEKTEDSELLVSVSDWGMGLPVDKPERIFDAFFTTKAQGTGMGLSISRRIIESHAGRLWASANSERGATFHFTLPIAPEAVEVPPKATA